MRELNVVEIDQVDGGHPGLAGALLWYGVRRYVIPKVAEAGAKAFVTGAATGAVVEAAAD